MKPTIHIRSDQLEAVRETAGLTSIAELARAMKLHPTSVARTLSGEAKVGSTFVAAALATFPDVPFDQLFTVTRAAAVPASVPA